MWNLKLLMVDKNQSWEPPEGYVLNSVKSMGAFLIVTFLQIRHVTDTVAETEMSEITVYLNDQGREVMRTTAWHTTDAAVSWTNVDLAENNLSGRPDHVKASNQFTASVKFYWNQIQKLFRRITWPSN